MKKVTTLRIRLLSKAIEEWQQRVLGEGNSSFEYWEVML